MSPYYLNPFDINPTRDLLNEIVDFERVRRQQALKLFLCATAVRTGKIAVFKNEEITADHVLASACMPFRMRAPEIHGEYYWDGGFMGNPAIFPVIYGCNACDILLVRLTPTNRAELPTTSRAILDRMQEISFNASLMREMRVVSFMTQMIDEGKLSGGKRMFIHTIEAEDIIKSLSGSSKMNADWKFLMHLFKLGRRTRGRLALGQFRSNRRRDNNRPKVQIFLIGFLLLPGSGAPNAMLSWPLPLIRVSRSDRDRCQEQTGFEPFGAPRCIDGRL